MEKNEILKIITPKNVHNFTVLKNRIIGPKDINNLGEVDNIRALINPQVRARDNNKCCFCGRDVQEVCRELGGGNTIHHKVPARYGGKHEESNLITICGYCHQRLEKYIGIVEREAIKQTLKYIRGLLE